MADFRKEFIAFCIGQGALKFGRFVTQSGRTTPYFFNAGLFNTGAALERLAQFYAKAILASGVDFDMLFGPAYKGIVLAASSGRTWARSRSIGNFMERLNMRNRTAVFVCLTVLAVAPAAAQQAPQRMYKCVDAKGKTYYTQMPPPECLGRETQELNKSGSVIRRTPREVPLTAEQKEAREAERKKKLEAEEKAKEERRKDSALLNTYSSEKDIDYARSQALKEAEAAIKETEKRIVDAQKRQKQLDSEKEFYTKKPMPVKLRQDIANIEIEIKNQQELLEAKKKEIGTINTKYDEDKRRYVELTRKARQAK